jgi:alpha-L-rhamnosidase
MLRGIAGRPAVSRANDSYDRHNALDRNRSRGLSADGSGGRANIGGGSAGNASLRIPGESARDRRARTTAELGSAGRKAWTARVAPERLPHRGGVERTGNARRSGGRVGFRQGELCRVDPNCVFGKAARIRTTRILAGPSLGSGREALVVERHRPMVDGLLDPSDWKAQWIGADEATSYENPDSVFRHLKSARWIGAATGAPGKPAYFRTSFRVPAGRMIRRAIVLMGADARYEFFLNGVSLIRGSNVRMPDLLDVTPDVRTGENTVAVRTEGPPAPPPGDFVAGSPKRRAALIGALRVEFDTGEPLTVATSTEWKSTEHESQSWEQPGFSDGGWARATDIGAYGSEPWGQVGFVEERALPARMLRKEFEIRGAVKQASAYVSGLGLSELYLNGTKVGDHVLSPGLTDYRKRVLYVTYDVTADLIQGRNALGLILGNGRYWAPRADVPIASLSFGYPKALCQIDVEYADGRKETIATDTSWKLTRDGPIRANNEYDGETYDARRELPGWAKAGFDDSKWEPSQAVATPAGRLEAEMAEPIRVVKTIKPVKVTEPKPGVYVFDMGQNMVGWCRLRVAGPRGTEVTLRHSETLQRDGTLYLDNLRSARALDQYFLKGGGAESWEPRFTYHGFRYVEVRGYPGKPPLMALEGRVVHDDMRHIADFRSSNDLLNQLHHNIVWGVRGNYRSIPTDCPQRDERQGWLGDRSMVSRSESYLFDIAAFYTKWHHDLEDSQNQAGSIPDVSPAYWKLYTEDITWPSTFIFVPGMLLEQYGDTRVVVRAYPAMRKWFEHMRSFVKDGLIAKDTYGDWCVPPENPKLVHSQDPARRTDKTLIATAYFQYLVQILAGYARIAGRGQDVAEYEDLAQQMRTSFERKFFEAGRATYGNGSQTSMLLPLALGITPDEHRTAVVASLTRKIEEESNGHIGVGLIGAQWLMRTLSDNGKADVAMQIATQRDYPGWGYMVENGATTVWELWNGDTADPAMNSGNHVMQIGDLGIWLYAYLGGIRPDPEQPGFRRAVIHPVVPSSLQSVHASHESMHGRFVTDWKRTGGQLALRVSVPPNTTAVVYVPTKGAVTESGKPAESAEGVKFLRREGEAAVYEVASGDYDFESRF